MVSCTVPVVVTAIFVTEICCIYFAIQEAPETYFVRVTVTIAIMLVICN